MSKYNAGALTEQRARWIDWGMRPSDDRDSPGAGRVRLDKWLWAARFFKTRSLAAEAVGGGKILVNGDRPKPAKLLQSGDEVSIRLGPYQHVVVVRGISERRGPATVAATLYEETAESLTARAKLAEQLRMAPAAFVFEDKGRPTKKDRREIDRVRDRES
jgi:ribosome-associated heat shock protein Hsp15